MNTVTPKRCAVYCRVSSDERLDQSFNSIDAQRESGLSFVMSQRQEGWTPVQDTYEDPGYSGGNMERPGLKRLMVDIQSGLIDMVVVYKIDRLSRSLTDFAKMVEIFDKHKVSFSSVTQQINSSTSTGRLMLNMLLSFAQFEREVTGERIRDKIAASKRKGLWMGGPVPLGYRVENRLLLIDEKEAQTVRWIFDTYASTGSVTQMVQQMKEQNLLTKSGRNFCKQSLYKVLNNRVYLGMLAHKGQYFAGAHSPLIEQDQWDNVQQLMSRPSEAKTQATWSLKARTQFLLRGLIYSPGGDLYLPMATQKKSGNFAPTRVFVVAFLIDFTIRLFVNPHYAPSMVIGQWLVRRQQPEWTGAPQKRFAWSIGFVLALTMLYLVVIKGVIGPINLLVCGLCLLLMFFESAFGICIGCWLYNRMRPDQAQLCPGGACEYSPDSKDQLKLSQLLVVLAFAGVMVFVAPGLAGKGHTTALTTETTSAPLDPKETERCKVPDFAKAMGHEEKWKLHNNCK